MPKAKKLPSGSWRCQVFDRYEDVRQRDGIVKRKRIYKSFTVDDPSPKGKKKCESLATEWSITREKRIVRSESSFTVSQAIQEYIQIKKNILSPASIRGYSQMANRYFSDIEDVRLEDLTSIAVQRWINKLAVDKSPKTISNVYGLLSTTCRFFAPDISFHVRLPQKKIYEGYVPTDKDMETLMCYLKDNEPELEKAVLLSASGTLRRSEICGITAADIDRKTNIIHIHRARVMNENGEWMIKDVPKNRSSDRYVAFPSAVIAKLPDTDPIVNLTPNRISIRFKLVLGRCGLPNFRFHDLRHYAASIMHALGVPDQYIMERGGWSSDSTLKRIYRGSMNDYEKKFTVLTNDHFDSLMQNAMQHEMQHEIEKAL